MPIKNYTTKVDVYTSLGEIQGALARNGACKIMIDYTFVSSVPERPTTTGGRAEKWTGLALLKSIMRRTKKH